MRVVRLEIPDDLLDALDAYRTETQTYDIKHAITALLYATLLPVDVAIRGLLPRGPIEVHCPICGTRMAIHAKIAECLADE
jgi:hypothetical protein